MELLAFDKLFTLAFLEVLVASLAFLNRYRVIGLHFLHFDRHLYIITLIFKFIFVLLQYVLLNPGVFDRVRHLNQSRIATANL